MKETDLKTLIKGGYELVPCVGKRPKTSQWLRKTFSEHDFTETDNVGIRTKSTPALDVDFDDEEAVRVVEEVVRDAFPVAPCRCGRRPRSLFLFTTRTPFRKIRVEFTNSGRRGAIEFLGDGQQFVAFGRHPSGVEYEWEGGYSPLDVDAESLPEIDRSKAVALVERIGESLSRIGWTKPRREKSEERVLPTVRNGDLPPGLREALDRLDATDYDDWISIGMRLKGAGVPFEVWKAWSMKASTYEEGACESKWATFDPRESDLHPVYEKAGVSTALLDFDVVPDIEEKKRKTSFSTLASIAERSPPEWLVKGLIPRKSLVSIVASPNAGKSFLLMDLARCIEEGDASWLGRRVRAPENAIVIVFSYEGSMVLRAKALANRYPGVGRRIVIEEGWPNLRDPEDVQRVVRRAREIAEELGGVVVAVAFDTLNLALQGGSENDAEDMGAAVGGMKAIRDALDCSVVVVHHLGKDASKGARGHSSLLGAVDTEVTVVADSGTPVREVAATKIRDGDRVGPFGWFRLAVVPLGVDDDLDPITSCVVEQVVEEEGTDERLRALATRITDILKSHPDGLPKSRLWQAVGGHKSRFLEDLDRLVQRGIIGFRAGGRGAISVVLVA